MLVSITSRTRGRPPRQTRWSKALVRRGADPGGGARGVLRVAVRGTFDLGGHAQRVLMI